MAWKEVVKRGIRGGGPLQEIMFKYAVYCALMLTTISVLDQADKWALPTLQISGLQCSSCGSDSEEFTEKCQDECLDITDAQMGFLLGPAFSLTSVFASLPIGYIADRKKRVRILLIGMVVWSSATLVSAFSQNFYQLAVLRMVLGLGAAAVNPTAFSLLSDYFPPNYRNTVMSTFQSTVYIGQDIGLLTGIIAQETSWRISFFILGLPGLILALPFFFTVWEPARGMSESNQSNTNNIEVEITEEPPAITLSKDDISNEKEDINVSTSISGKPRESRIYYEEWIDFTEYTTVQKIRYIITMPTFIVMWISSALRFMGGYGLGSWVQVFYRRVFGLSPTQISLWLAVIIPVGGLTASYAGGGISDWWKKRLASASAWVLSLCSFAAIPFLLAMLFAHGFRVSFLFLFGEYLFAEMWIGPSVAIVQDIIPPPLRTISSAIFFLSLAVGGMSPFLLGWLIEEMAIKAPYEEGPDSYDPTYPMAIVIGGTYFLSAIGFIFAAILLQKRYYSIRAEKESLTDCK